MAKRAKKEKSRLRRLAGRAGIILGIAILALFSIHQHVLWSGQAHISSIEETAPTQCILVLGASVLRDGRPSSILEDRLRATTAIAKRHPKAKVLVSGDQEPGYDEVSIMASYLRRHGVANDRIVIDPKGYRTFDSMYRARNVYGFDQVTVVTNPFHAPRAVFLGRHLGIDARGVGAPHGIDYQTKTLMKNRVREAAARILAFADVYLLGTQPRAAE